MKPGVTLQLLWEEYAQDCRLEGKVFYQLTQFKKHFNEYLNKTNFSHILHHKAGEQAQSISKISPGFRRIRIVALYFIA